MNRMNPRRNSFGVCAGFAFCLMILFANNAAAQAPLKVCADPSAPCKSPNKEFAPYELSFQLPKRLRPNIGYKSAPFWAVLLKSKSADPDTDCDEGEYSSKLENERKRVQSMFPDRKVFADQQCPDMGAVSYTISGKNNVNTFLAVYGGATRAEAETLLLKLKNKYPAALVKSMQVSFEQAEQ